MFGKRGQRNKVNFKYGFQIIFFNVAFLIEYFLYIFLIKFEKIEKHQTTINFKKRIF